MKFGKMQLQQILFIGHKIDIRKQTKYPGIYLDEHFTRNFLLKQIKTKLSSCGPLAKLRYFVEKDLLRTLYFANFIQS